MKTFTRIIGLLLVMIALSACGGQTETSTLRDDIHIAVSVPDETLAIGETMLMVSVSDADGSPIDGATVKAQGDMDHAGMEAVNGQTDESSEGVYMIPFTWTMGGGWVVTVTVDLPDNAGTASETFEYFVEAISQDSVINQDGDSDMGDMNMPDAESDN